MNLKTQVTKGQKLGLGSIVVFSQYGTSYVVHVADHASVVTHGTHPADSYQLYRLDGQKPYRRVPMTGIELTNLVDNLNGEVYHPDEYELQLVKK